MTLTREVLLAFRPKTLTAAFVPCVAATGLAYALHLNVDVVAFFCALLAAFWIQIGTNLVNDAVDFTKGADTETRIGPRRITAAGVLTSKQVMKLGTACFVLAVLFGIPLVVKGGWVIVLIGLVSVAMGYAYTAGPFPLAYLGLGDAFVVLFFGLIAVGGLFFLHTGTWTMDAFWLGLQIGAHATVLIAINNFRDATQDVLVGKKTLAVRFGADFSRWEIVTLSLLPYGMNGAWWGMDFRAATLLPLLALPLTVMLLLGIWFNEPGPGYNRYLGMAAGQHLLFGLLLSIGFFLR